MTGKLVSAIITTHNRVDLLPKAIDSVLSQTYSPIECVVVSDASSDGTVEYCKARNDIKFINIEQDESRGGNYARNCGIKAATGELIAFLDDDDEWLPQKIEKQVQKIEEKGCGFVFCGSVVNYYSRGKLVAKAQRYPLAFACGDVSRIVLYTIITTTSNMLVRKKLLVETGMFDESLKFWQEYELTIRLAQRTHFYFVNELLSVYRVDASDKSRLTNKFFAWKEAVKKIREKHKILFSKLSLNEKRKVLAMTWFDAQERCKTSGLKCRFLLYSIGLRFVRPRQYILDILKKGNEKCLQNTTT